jgi:hypothetical protein
MTCSCEHRRAAAQLTDVKERIKNTPAIFFLKRFVAVPGGGGASRLLASPGSGAMEIRTPKAEARKKPEIRRPKATSRGGGTVVPPGGRDLPRLVARPSRLRVRAAPACRQAGPAVRAWLGARRPPNSPARTPALQPRHFPWPARWSARNRELPVRLPCRPGSHHCDRRHSGFGFRISFGARASGFGLGIMGGFPDFPVACQKLTCAPAGRPASEMKKVLPTRMLE